MLEHPLFLLLFIVGVSLIITGLIAASRGCP